MRYIILGILIYLLYRLLKNLLSGTAQYSQKVDNDSGKETVEDEMVKDPQCGVYYPKKEMLPFLKDGQTVYFCSRQCKDEYVRKLEKEV